MSRYLSERTLYGPLIEKAPPVDLSVVAVIPARSELHLITSLESLAACERPQGSVEVIVVANAGEDDEPETLESNRSMAEEAERWGLAHRSDWLTFHVLKFFQLPRKEAGVGLARKIGMDEACRRFESLNKDSGVIACFDADSFCAPNYLVELERCFREDASCQACSIYFEHPLQGQAHPPEVYEAITAYELHLRYFINALRFAGFPWATQTIGSSMAVRRDAYEEQNGMNRRKAGEDFYFLHKFTPLGRVRELTTTTVYPSPRPSERVPFGTGRAVAKLLASNEQLRTYSLRSFHDLREFTRLLPELEEGIQPAKQREAFMRELPGSIAAFLSVQPTTLWERVDEIHANCSGKAQFRNRFFRWFNAFLAMKFAHFARDNFHPDVPVNEAGPALLELLIESPSQPGTTDLQELLGEFRKIDRSFGLAQLPRSATAKASPAD